MNFKYEIKRDIKPSELEGIGNDQLEQHWTLYEGYVKNVNMLNEEISALTQKKQFGVQFAELKRRIGFEYDGMILHEHYFSILKAGQKPLGDFAELTKMFKKFYGGFASWKEEFQAMGGIRGIGWVILYFDPLDQILANHWVGQHEIGHPAGYKPILVMDVWEHAYMVDHGASGRAAYVESFIKNIDWPKIEENLKTALKTSEGKPVHVGR